MNTLVYFNRTLEVRGYKAVLRRLKDQLHDHHGLCELSIVNAYWQRLSRGTYNICFDIEWEYKGKWYMDTFKFSTHDSQGWDNFEGIAKEKLELIDKYSRHIVERLNAEL